MHYFYESSFNSRIYTKINSNLAIFRYRPLFSQLSYKAWNIIYVVAVISYFIWLLSQKKKTNKPPNKVVPNKQTNDMMYDTHYISNTKILAPLETLVLEAGRNCKWQRPKTPSSAIHLKWRKQSSSCNQSSTSTWYFLSHENNKIIVPCITKPSSSVRMWKYSHFFFFM